jgi:hypothetical protein
VQQIQLALLDERLMDPFTLLSRTISPARYGAFIQPKGMHDRLHGTPIG